MDMYALITLSNLACVTSQVSIDQVIHDCGQPDKYEIVESKLYQGVFTRLVYYHETWEEHIYFHLDGRVRSVEVRKLGAAPSL
jgi:hypothetical protein